jgi:hypothetical protein
LEEKDFGFGEAWRECFGIPAFTPEKTCCCADESFLWGHTCAHWWRFSKQADVWGDCAPEANAEDDDLQRLPL